MKNNKFMRFGIVITMMLTLVFSSLTVSFAEYESKTMPAYQAVIKGKYAYCATVKGIYKVNLKNKKKKLLVKCPNYPYRAVGSLRLHKGYIYYLDGGTGIGANLCRVKTNGKNRKKLAVVYTYAISKNTIYYTTYKKSDKGKELYRKMSLNGKNKKSSKYDVRIIPMQSNKAGYLVETVSKGTTHTDYLVKPNNKKIKICKCKSLI